jgi:hypothetical protein
MNKLKVTLAAIVMLVSVVGTVAANASQSQAFNCSSVQGQPPDRLASRCDGADVTCCFQGSLIVKGHYNIN